MLPNSGRILANGTVLDEQAYAQAISAALRSELGSTRRATKTVMRWTGACDKSARNWVNGLGAPSGVHLMCLATECDAVWRMIVDITGHYEVALADDLHAVEVALAKAAGAFEVLKRQRMQRR